MLKVEIGTSTFFNEFAHFVSHATKPCLELVLSIDLETSEDAHNEKLQKAVGAVGYGLFDLFVAKGRKFWGAPDYRFDDYESMMEIAWIREAVLPITTVFVGWKREANKVAYVIAGQEDTSLSFDVWVGVAYLPSD